MPRQPAPACPPAPEAELPTRSLSVAARLRDAILAGEHAPGERLHEIRLGTQLGVSRTPVRAALQALAAEGLLDYAPNRGYAVREVPASETLDAFEIRAALEGVAARLAAERGPGAAARAAIAASLRAGDLVVARGTLEPADMAEFRAVNIAYHDAVLAAAGNPRLGEMIRLCQAAPASSTRRMHFDTPAQLRRFHDDHHRIAEAIEAREGWRAELLMREHVGALKSMLVRRLGPRG